MPTEEEFTAVARDLRVNVAEVNGLEWYVRNLDGDVGIEGDTKLARGLDQGVAATYINLDRLSDELDRIAEVLTTRAGEAATYTSAMKTWRQQHQTWSSNNALWILANAHPAMVLDAEHPGTEPTEPPRAPQYVDESRPGSLT